MSRTTLTTTDRKKHFYYYLEKTLTIGARKLSNRRRDDEAVEILLNTNATWRKHRRLVRGSSEVSWLRS